MTNNISHVERFQVCDVSASKYQSMKLSNVDARHYGDEGPLENTEDCK